MTPREKILGISVASVLVLAGGQMLLSRYRAAVAQRTVQIETLDNQLIEARDKQIRGAYADRQMGEYLIRSLPSDPERARADYTRWLLYTTTLLGLRDTSVSPSQDLPVGDLYRRYGFKVSGKTDSRGWLELMHAFYSQDYLHRISEMSVQPSREGDGTLAVSLTIDAIGLSAAAADAPPPTSIAPWVGDYQDYADAILNRSFFSPPNQPPRFTSPTRLTANLGETATLNVAAEDPDHNRIRYSLVGEVPEGVALDERSGTIRWEPRDLGDFALTVRASDDGYPPKSTEQEIVVAVVQPPPPPKEPDPLPGFDDSTQTVLTALVQGGGDWTAWMKVRTRGTTLKLRPGDPFEIGSLKGSVVEVNAKFVVLEIDGQRFELRPAGNLAEAAKVALQP